MTTNGSNLKDWVIPAIAILAFISFFLDWISVHALFGIIGNTYSGLDILQKGMDSQFNISPVSMVAVVGFPISAIAVLLFFFNKRMVEMVVSMGVSLLFALWLLVRARPEVRANTEGLFKFNYETGFILMELCALAFAILLIMKLSKRGE